jgi:hypothetical protein
MTGTTAERRGSEERRFRCRVELLMECLQVPVTHGEPNLLPTRLLIYFSAPAVCAESVARPDLFPGGSRQGLDIGTLSAIMGPQRKVPWGRPIRNERFPPRPSRSTTANLSKLTFAGSP